MSQNFSAEQYESVYTPKCLGHWEVPKKFKEYPRSLEGFTEPATQENGHFLPGICKPAFKEWSQFEGTWGKDFYKPGKVKGVDVNPGFWMVKGRRATWIDAIKIEVTRNKPSKP